MRNLQTDDMFNLIAVLEKIDMQEIIKLYDGAEGLDNTQFGIAIAGLLIKNIPHCRKALYEFVGPICGIDAEDVGRMGLAEFAKTVEEIVTQDGWADFFEVVQRFVGKGESSLSTPSMNVMQSPMQ